MMTFLRSRNSRLSTGATVTAICAIVIPAVLFAAVGPDSFNRGSDHDTLEQADRLYTPPSGTGTRIPVGAETPIPSNFDVSNFLSGAGDTESSAWEPSGNFRMTCQFSHFAYDDPIVYPGQRGASHLHMFFGNTGADANSTYESLRRTGDSTCQGGPINRSAYWMPAVLTASGQAVTPEFISVYYKGPGHSTTGERVDVAEMPAGLRMIAGAKPSDPSADSRHLWYCEDTQNKSRTIPSCPSGERVGVQMEFPTCWNGTDLDSPDHRSHLTYFVYDNGTAVCPTSHPVSIPEFTLGVWFSHAPDSADWYLSSDRMPGQPQHANGSSFHSDWFGAWDPDVMRTWTDRCINGLLNCSGGDLGNRTSLESVPDYSGPTRLAQPVRSVSLFSSGQADVTTLACDLVGTKPDDGLTA